MRSRAIVAKRLSSWRRFGPLLCPSWLPIQIVVSISFGDSPGNIVGFDYAAVLWDLPGQIVVRSDSAQPAPAPEFAVQNR